MKKNDRIQLKNAGVPELEKRVADARAKLLTLQRETALGKVKNVRQARGLRKDIARLLTEITIQKSNG